MRLLRPALLSLALALPVVAPSPAVAATIVTGLPDGWFGGAQSCQGGDGAGHVRTEQGPGTPPAGVGSLELFADADEQTSVAHEVGSLAGLSSWDMWMYPGDPNGAFVVIQVVAEQELLFAQPAVSSNSWSAVDARAMTFEWQGFSGEPAGTGTIDDYLTARGDNPATLAVFSAACSAGASRVNIDAYSWTESGSFTEYDFEPASAPTTSTISSSAKTIAAGKDVTLRTTLKSAGKVLKGVPVELFGREAGEPDFTSVGVAMTNTDGVAKVIHSPQRNTTYQWRFAGGGGGAATESATRVVQVRSHVTLALADSSLRKGQKLVGTGKVTPAKVGEDATLWRVTKKGRTRLDRGAIGADGRYEVAAKVKQAGTWKVVVTVPAAGGNEAGTSPARKATVK